MERFDLADAFLGAELRDCQTAVRLAADAIAPECMETWGREFVPWAGLLKRDGLVRFAGYQARQEW